MTRPTPTNRPPTIGKGQDPTDPILTAEGFAPTLPDLAVGEVVEIELPVTIEAPAFGRYTIKGQFSDIKYREYAGIPAIGSTEYATYEIPLDRYPGATDTPKSTVENNMVTGRWNYVFNDSTGFNFAARFICSTPCALSPAWCMAAPM